MALDPGPPSASAPAFLAEGWGAQVRCSASSFLYDPWTVDPPSLSYKRTGWCFQQWSVCVESATPPSGSFWVTPHPRGCPLDFLEKQKTLRVPPLPPEGTALPLKSWVQEQRARLGTAGWSPRARDGAERGTLCPGHCDPWPGPRPGSEQPPGDVCGTNGDRPCFGLLLTHRFLLPWVSAAAQNLRWDCGPWRGSRLPAASPGPRGGTPDPGAGPCADLTGRGQARSARPGRAGLSAQARVWADAAVPRVAAGWRGGGGERCSRRRPLRHARPPGGAWHPGQGLWASEGAGAAARDSWPSRSDRYRQRSRGRVCPVWGHQSRTELGAGAARLVGTEDPRERNEGDWKQAGGHLSTGEVWLLWQTLQPQAGSQQAWD
nr:uncharacterized protein LOC104651475 [Saimiri boliviensis boliviensis]